MNSRDLKEKYLSFFERHEHKRIHSAPLIPENDPTVLFTTAGMHPLVPFLMGEPHPAGDKLCNVQKCIRTGDVEEVGDASHLTFFEMLGNWSLGDYFKDDAIQMSYDFLTKELGIDSALLAVSVFVGDDDSPFDEEAHDKWLQLGIPPQRIARLPKKNNWWGPAGETGPCGPDTEMFIWTGKPDEVPESFNDDHELWVEVWNDVFMQYYKDKDGNYSELKQKNVDTGMGVERMAAVPQGKDNVYDTDTIRPILEKVHSFAKSDVELHDRSCRIITDHLRAAVFMLGDDKPTLPSNVDQGYVLRKLIRRSIRHLHTLQAEDIPAAVQNVASLVIEQYPDWSLLEQNREKILHALREETDKFMRTIEKGLRLIEKKMQSEALTYTGIKPKGREDVQRALEKFTQEETEVSLSGEWLFDLFQSHGMPPEMTIEEIRDAYNCIIENRTMVMDEFDNLFEEHQQKSRAGAEKKFKGGLADSSEESRKLHTATHLLNEALRKVLDSDIRQRGSNITPERLRFDFNFDRKLTDEEKQRVEDEVNRVIDAALPVTKEKMSLQEAIDSGAQQEFGQKYPDEVWVYSIGDYSKEICMGPHVENTKELGAFRISKEQSSAAGIRRIKAVVE